MAEIVLKLKRELHDVKEFPNPIIYSEKHGSVVLLRDYVCVCVYVGEQEEVDGGSGGCR